MCGTEVIHVWYIGGTCVVQRWYTCGAEVINVWYRGGTCVVQR